MNDRIRGILEAAILAPSGDNCQPWRFVIQGNRIDIFNDPASDTSYYNYQQRASLVAHGALLENIVIAAPPLGFDASLILFPAPDDPCHVARVILEDCPAREVVLAPFIAHRSTNRKRYRGGALDDNQLQRLRPPHEDLPAMSLFLSGAEQDLQAMAEVICLSDRLVFENRLLHDFLFEHIRWSEAEALRTRDGLDIRTLELGAMDAVGFRFLKNWAFTSFVGRLGATAAVADNARKLARSASAIGVILGNGSRSHDTYLQGGRLLQRIWLQATSLGLAFHPMTGISFLMQRVIEGQADELSPYHVRLLENALQNVATTCGVSRPDVIAIFRVGFADPPSARSLRNVLPPL